MNGLAVQQQGRQFRLATGEAEATINPGVLQLPLQLPLQLAHLGHAYASRLLPCGAPGTHRRQSCFYNSIAVRHPPLLHCQAAELGMHALQAV